MTLHYGFQDPPQPPSIWQLRSICQNKLALWVVEIYFLWKQQMCQYWTEASTWFIGLFSWAPDPTGRSFGKNFSSHITRALAEYIKRIQIPPERVTNYDMYLHMFNHIYLISFCYFCRAPRLRKPPPHRAGTACARQSSLRQAFCCRTVSFLCYLFQWNLKFTIFKWCVWNCMTLLCHNIIHPKILVKGSPPSSPPPQLEIRALLRK